MKSLIWSVAVVILALSFSLASGQAPKDPQRPRDQKTATTSSTDALVDPPQNDVETLKIDTNLVTVPVIASSRTGNYVSDLRKEEFKLSEDGVPQEIAFLATVSAPFYVVLMLDTSDSTENNLKEIQRAAIAFLNQLGPRDKVKIISFDDELHDWNDFTGDRAVLRASIERTKTGKGTRVYDAMQMGLDLLRPIRERKAIVLFTDGVDWHSESSTFETTVRDLDECGVIVYPIRFDTRAFTEQVARKQEAEQNGGPLPTSGILRIPTSGGTPTTFPSGDPSPVPTMKREPLPIPPPSVIFGGGRHPIPPIGSPTAPFPDSGTPIPRRDNPNPNRNPGPDPGGANDRRQNDTISAMLDNMYLMADSYLKQVADRSGGQVYRADNIGFLPQAFAAIADELRTQYLLGYYPINRVRDGSYRKIQVKTVRKDIAIRARPGYRARGSE